MNDNYEILVCKYPFKKTKHFIKKPKFLPCNESICEECIQLNQNGIFFCKFCSNAHHLSEITANENLEEIIDNNLSNLTKIKIKDFSENKENLKSIKLLV
jgi:hypothetical protein